MEIVPPHSRPTSLSPVSLSPMNHLKGRSPLSSEGTSERTVFSPQIVALQSKPLVTALRSI